MSLVVVELAVELVAVLVGSSPASPFGVMRVGGGITRGCDGVLMSSVSCGVGGQTGVLVE